MIPNIVVQNIASGENIDNSYIQSFGKRTVAYLKNLVALQNVNGYIRFSTDMILWMLNIQNNIARERKYFKDFISQLEQNSLISIQNEVDTESLGSSEFIHAKLNIFDYNEEGKTQNYFMLLDSEYNKIMNYSGDLDRFNLLNLFCNLKSRMWRNSNDISPAKRRPEVAYPSYETIKDDIFIESDKTLKQYIEVLVELDLIRYDSAGERVFVREGDSLIVRKSNFTYTLFHSQWETDLSESISAYKKKKESEGWAFRTAIQEISSDNKRSITQKIHMLEKKATENTLTQAERKDLGKLKRQQAKWKSEYDNDVDIHKLEEDKLKSENVAVHIPHESAIGNSNPFNPFIVEEQKVKQEVSEADNAQEVQDLEARRREWEQENNKNVVKIIRKVQVERNLESKTKIKGDKLKPFVEVISSERTLVSKSKFLEDLEDKNPGVFTPNIPEKFYEKAADVFIREKLKADEQKYWNDKVEESGFYDLDKLIKEGSQAV